MNLELSLQEINVLLTGLGRLPYESVFELVEKVKSQAVPQINKAQAAPEENK